MDRRIALTVFFVVFSATIGWGEEKTTIAILDFEAQGTSQNDANVLTERVRVELFKTDRYTVMERSRMREILLEQGFQQAVCNESECIIEAGHILGVQQMVAGSVQKIGTLHTISLRIVEVATGKVLAMASSDCKECTIEDVAIQTTGSVVQNLLQPESTSKAYQGNKPYSESPSKYFGQLQLGAREIYEDGTRGELGIMLGLQFGRELSRWFRVAASIDRFSKTYTEHEYSGWTPVTTINTKVSYFIYGISLDLQFPLRSSWFKPYMGVGINYAFLNSEGSYSGSSIQRGKYEGVGFSWEIGTEFRFSKRLGAVVDVQYLRCKPESVVFSSFDLSGATTRLGVMYHF